MVFHCLAVAFRQIAPSYETHHLFLIEEQNGSAIAVESCLNRIECRVVNFGKRYGDVLLLGKLIKRFLLLLAAFPRGDVSKIKIYVIAFRHRCDQNLIGAAAKIHLRDSAFASRGQPPNRGRRSIADSHAEASQKFRCYRISEGHNLSLLQPHDWRRVFHGQAAGEYERLFSIFARSDIVVCFEDIRAVSSRIAVNRPAREHDQTAVVPRGVNDLALPVIITKQFLVDFRQRLGVFRFQQIVDHSAKRFLRRVTVKFCCPSVPVSDPIVCIANDDGVVSQIQQPRLLG